MSYKHCSIALSKQGLGQSSLTRLAILTVEKTWSTYFLSGKISQIATIRNIIGLS